MHYVIIYKDILEIDHVLIKNSYLVDTEENKSVHGHELKEKKV